MLPLFQWEPKGTDIIFLFSVLTKTPTISTIILDCHSQPNFY